MKDSSSPPSVKFFITHPQPCPYLEGKVERRLFVQCDEETQATELQNYLMQQGFRRAQNTLYRPCCTDCQACLSLRIRVNDFVPSKSQKRTLRRNEHLSARVVSPIATAEHYQLFREYILVRHSDGSMADMTENDFIEWLEDTPAQTFLTEFRDAGELIAVSMTDVLQDGLSMVYSFFSPTHSRMSLGLFMILNQVRYTSSLGLSHLYLGYWVPNSAKMAYKCRFSGLEIYLGNQWQPFRAPENYDGMAELTSTISVASQAAELRLPEFEN
ncbi:MAG: arginyltransferase [Aestuariivita sp.]|nr:arginyltransferase [Aestuariivita sp.]MCY4201029.1 arginyltransferase [Aestuariivita sp.]